MTSCSKYGGSSCVLSAANCHLTFVLTHKVNKHPSGASCVCVCVRAACIDLALSTKSAQYVCCRHQADNYGQVFLLSQYVLLLSGSQQDRQCMYKRNIEACSCNHFCCAKAINITYFECVSAVAYRGGVWGGSTPPPKFRIYRWSPRSHEQEEQASRFPFVVHSILIRL